MADTLHGLIQKAHLDAERLLKAIRVNPDGTVWKNDSPSNHYTWYKDGTYIPAKIDAEDFLVGKLTQEDR